MVHPRFFSSGTKRFLPREYLQEGRGRGEEKNLHLGPHPKFKRVLGSHTSVKWCERTIMG